jgi:hypothetical protein
MQTYTCGCTKPKEFIQCQEREGTNAKCSPMPKVQEPPKTHMCIDHMVNPDAMVMCRLGHTSAGAEQGGDAK